MPLFRINDQLHVFAHVPKCGGTSVEHYLADRFGPIAFHETDWNRRPAEDRWTRSHAQHIPADALSRLFPAGWIASSFAVVRHPVSRLISAFFYERDVSAKAALSSEFNAWFQAAIHQQRANRFSHVILRPQIEFVPEGARIFRFEDGLDQIIPYLDALAGSSDGPRVMPSENIGRWRNEDVAPRLTRDTLDLVAQVYAEDLARYGYAMPDDGAPVQALVALPATASTGTPPAPPRRSLMTRLQRSLMRRAGL